MLHAQVMGKDAEVMLEEAKALREIDQDIIVKVRGDPAGAEKR